MLMSSRKPVSPSWPMQVWNSANGGEIALRAMTKRLTKHWEFAGSYPLTSYIFRVAVLTCLLNVHVDPFYEPSQLFSIHSGWWQLWQSRAGNYFNVRGRRSKIGMCPSHQSYVGKQKCGKKILLRSTHFQHAVGTGLILKVCTTYTCSVMHQK